MTTATPTKDSDPRVILTPEARIAFPYLFVPRARSKDKPDGRKTYQCSLLFPPTTDFKPFVEALKTAMIEKWGKVIPLAASKNPIRDCAEKSNLEGYKPGWRYINLHSGIRPGVVTRQNVPVADESLVYGGMWVRAFINAFAWSHPDGGNGVSFGLQGVQLVRDDEKFSKSSVMPEFTALDPIPPGGVPGAKTAAPGSLDSLFG